MPNPLCVNGICLNQNEYLCKQFYIVYQYGSFTSWFDPGLVCLKLKLIYQASIMIWSALSRMERQIGKVSDGWTKFCFMYNNNTSHGCTTQSLKAKALWWCCCSVMFSVQVRLRTEVLRTPSSTQLGFKLIITSRSWRYIWCPPDTCFNHSAISELPLRR